MSPPGAPHFITRHYVQDAQYTADAGQMAAAGWRVVSIQREPTGAIVATYAFHGNATVLPSPSSPFGTPRKRMPINRRMFFMGAGAGGLLIIAVVVALLFANLSPSGAAPSAGSAVSAGAATQTASAAYTSALDATSTAAPNATPAPTATPEPTFSPAQTYDAIAQANCNFLAVSVRSTWNAAHATVSVTAQVGPPWDINALHTTVENIVFDCFKAFYTSPETSAVQWVDVSVKGPVTDSYGNNTIGLYGQADLSRASARPFNWDNLDYLQAWNNGVYDSQWERNS